MRLHMAPTLFDRFFSEVDSVLGAPATRAGEPAVDVLEHADRYEVSVELPGLGEKDVEVEFAEGVLEIRGRWPQAERGEARVLRRERPQGAFRRALLLGEEIDVEGIAARFCDGVLVVTAPKSERARPRQIPVSLN